MKNLSIALLIGICTMLSCKSQLNDPNETSMGDNSRTSLDWNGTYYGMLPCADCEGIQTMIILNNDLTYSYKTRYQGKEDAEIITKTGKFQWSDDSSKVTLEGLPEPNKFLVGENRLFKLNKDGKRITGDLESSYILEKQENNLTNKYWKLIELQGKPVKTVEGQREIHFILKPENQRIGGFAGCNNLNGTYEIQPANRIKFSKIATTMKACIDMTQEKDFLKILEMADSYNLSKDTLKLYRARMAPLAKFEAVYFY